MDLALFQYHIERVLGYNMNINKFVSNIIVVLLVAVLSGCSTIVVHSKKDATPPPYSGTKVALTTTKKLWYKYDFYGAVTLSVLDIPFSFMADTLLYPIDMYRLNNITETLK